MRLINKPILKIKFQLKKNYTSKIFKFIFVLFMSFSFDTFHLKDCIVLVCNDCSLI